MGLAHRKVDASHNWLPHCALSHYKDVIFSAIKCGGSMSNQPYTIDHTSNSRRRAVEDWLFGLDLVTPDLREKVVTAWVSTWSSSP
jgi:hypothetical protein